MLDSVCLCVSDTVSVSFVYTMQCVYSLFARYNVFICSSSHTNTVYIETTRKAVEMYSYSLTDVWYIVLWTLTDVCMIARGMEVVDQFAFTCWHILPAAASDLKISLLFDVDIQS